MSGRVHGSLQEDEARRFGRSRGEFLDFSANLNPFGPPKAALSAARRADLTRYPDPECRELRSALAAKLRVSEREVLIGNGSSELIHLLAHAYVRPGQAAAVFTPAFSEYTAALEAAGACVQEIAANPDAGFAWDLEEAAQRLQALNPALAFLGCPNNPTGVYPERAAVRKLAAALGTGVLALDEAYVSFVENPWRSLRLAPNVAVLRSLTKQFSVPGLRIGYLVAPRSVVEQVVRQQPSWSVSAPAQKAALACLAEDAFLAESLARLCAAKRGLVALLEGAGFKVHAGAANFVLVRVGDGASVRSRLLERGIAVRDCASFGLPEFIRVAVRRLPDCRLFVKVLEEIVR